MMNLQYILDGMGKTTGVFIPIGEWDELLRKLRSAGVEALSVPQWQMELVAGRLSEYKSGRQEAVDFEKAMDDIEKNI